jgi:hypothetical protein
VPHKTVKNQPSLKLQKPEKYFVMDDLDVIVMLSTKVRLSNQAAKFSE